MERKPAVSPLPLLILFAVFALAWCDLYLPQPRLDLFSPAWFGFAAAKSALRTAFILFAMARWTGLASFRLGAAKACPRGKDALDGLLVASAAAAFALLLALFAFLAGAANPLLASYGGGSLTPAGLLAMALSSLGTGYSEELFFRFFAVESLERAGISPHLAVLASAAMFGASHASQGIFGVAGAAALALIFSFFRSRGKSAHALALGHALYDFLVFVATI